MAAGKAKIKIRLAKISDYDGLIALWRTNEITLRSGDNKAGIKRLLARNPGLSLVAVEKGKIIGAALGAWDGRRGWIHHLAVEKRHRRNRIATSLISGIEARMRQNGVLMVKAEIYGANKASMKLFMKKGYMPYSGLVTVGKTLTKNK